MLSLQYILLLVEFAFNLKQIDMDCMICSCCIIRSHMALIFFFFSPFFIDFLQHRNKFCPTNIHVLLSDYETVPLGLSRTPIFDLYFIKHQQNTLPKEDPR